MAFEQRPSRKNSFIYTTGFRLSVAKYPKCPTRERYPLLSFVLSAIFRTTFPTIQQEQQERELLLLEIQW